MLIGILKLRDCNADEMVSRHAKWWCFAANEAFV